MRGDTNSRANVQNINKLICRKEKMGSVSDPHVHAVLSIVIRHEVLLEKGLLTLSLCFFREMLDLQAVLEVPGNQEYE